MHLIFQVSNEYETLIVTVEMTAEYAVYLQDKMALATQIKEGHPEFAWLKFFDGADLYESSTVNEGWIEEHADEDLKMWEKERYVITDKPPVFDKGVSVDMTYLFVDENSVLWSVRPKHSDQVLETMCVMGDNTEIFPKEG